ncbi:hypothetical protein [Sediminitomix flava]|uniref:Uncharacterized protein n=1 Tax=Sediminitomix flava TaxID=379075 RepID=A0A315ZC70_SEDFL|nr:hypothetical protein [Sediminitomix flava]PWJ42693.1 hypothetical protein BC781_102238 [Sediminitomix flava]
MYPFLNALKNRNKILFYFGCFCCVGALISILFILFTDRTVFGINAWIKPFKFFISSAIFAWTMAWYIYDLSISKRSVSSYSWVLVFVLLFETIYIAIQASKGELSHFNTSSAFYSMMFGLMGILITILTLWTAYIGILFFTKPTKNMPIAYLWGIRLGIITFVIFAFEGGIMAQKLTHTIGHPDGSEGLPILNWSTQYGDLRVAHFLGMHALQLFPFLGYYVFRKAPFIISFAMVYFALVSFSFWQALQGQSIFSLF